MIVSIVLVLLIVLALLYLILFPPPRETSSTLASLRVVAAVFAGVAGGLFGWSIQIHGKIWRQIGATAAGGGAAFLVVFLLFYRALPVPVGPEAFQMTATLDGTNVILSLAVPEELDEECRSVFLEPDEGACTFTGAQRVDEGERCATIDVIPVRIEGDSLRSRTMQVRVRNASGGCEWKERLPLECTESGPGDDRVLVTRNCN